MNGATAYRRSLRWYPSEWRERNAESAISAYLDRDDALGRFGPSRVDRATPAWSGVLETAVAPFRRARLPTTATGITFAIAAVLYIAVLDVPARFALLAARTGNVATIALGWSGAVAFVGVIVAIGWIVAAAIALRRGHRVASLALIAVACGASVTTYLLSWPKVQVFTPTTLALIVLIAATAGPFAGAIAATRAGLLRQSALWIIGVSLLAQLLGAAIIAELADTPTRAEIVAIVACAYLPPLAQVASAICFVFQGRGTQSRTTSAPSQPSALTGFHHRSRTSR
ncbi:NAD(P)(+) transhydrogenase (Re/Si-specific) subunit beta [Rathayibacter sp. AY1F6]|uniref:NAD(P)(+) transhydrogenase (Re/Si-specific) subunit beta n=1 Tax=Rathayibacter sp. AY1F6 TaxID=2080560 RepID=UPI0011B0B1D5|nr:NAD(P)(+) transhydrogenase (Re/Si-specific) subunit beta [Rathayibacter sp. AY1F6]